MKYENDLFLPSRILASILARGGKIIRTPNKMANMRNGLRYFAVEVTVGEINYYIQAFGKEATDLYDLTINFNIQNTHIVREIENY
jgi:hypothetical protein